MVWRIWLPKPIEELLLTSLCRNFKITPSVIFRIFLLIFMYSNPLFKIIRFTLIVLGLFISCNSNKPQNLKQSIEDFDSQYGTEINALCDSLINAVGKSKSYVMSISLDDEEYRFRQFDSTGHVSSYLKVAFKPTKSQVNFLTRAGVSTFQYKQKPGIFFARLTSFKSKNHTVWLYVDYEHSRGAAKKPVFFEKENRVYILIKS